jgi:hypothetical protein
MTEIYCFVPGRLPYFFWQMLLEPRLHRIEGHYFLHWTSFRDQFGQEYKQPKDFKRAFERALGHALAVYPQARVKVAHGGLLLHASPPPVTPRGGFVRRRALIGRSK